MYEARFVRVFSGENRTKSIDPKPHALMANIYTTLVEQVFDVSKRERKPDIHHHRKLGNLRRCLEIAERVVGHLPSVEQGG